MNDLILVLSKINIWKYLRITLWHQKRNWKYILSKEYRIDYKRSSFYGVCHEFRRCIRYRLIDHIRMTIKYGNKFLRDRAEHIWIGSVLGDCLKKKYEKKEK